MHIIQAEIRAAPGVAPKESALPPPIAWGGVFSAVATQFRDDISLDVDATARVMEGRIRDGVSGLTDRGRKRAERDRATLARLCRAGDVPQACQLLSAHIRHAEEALIAFIAAPARGNVRSRKVKYKAPRHARSGQRSGSDRHDGLQDGDLRGIAAGTRAAPSGAAIRTLRRCAPGGRQVGGRARRCGLHREHRRDTAPASCR